MRLTLAAMLLAGCLARQAGAADIEAGRAKAAACAACHGANGVSTAPAIPSLAGQREKFLQWQLVFFRSGRRENAIMGPIASALSDEDVRDLGAYYASLPLTPPPPPAPDPALRQAGEALAAQHRCASCHTDTWKGKQAAPAIGFQHKEYLAKALSDYRSGARPSVGVAAMTEAASGLSDGDIAALAQYLAAYR